MAAILKVVCDSIMSMGLQNLQFATIFLKNNNGTTKNRIAFILMAAILYFLILGLIPLFDSVDPVLIGFSMLRTPYMQVFMLSSGNAHVGLLMLHIDSAISVSSQSFTQYHVDNHRTCRIRISDTSDCQCHGRLLAHYRFRIRTETESLSDSDSRHSVTKSQTSGRGLDLAYICVRI